MLMHAPVATHAIFASKCSSPPLVTASPPLPLSNGRSCGVTRAGAVSSHKISPEFTTSASALLALLIGASDPGVCCGRGTGLDDAGLSHKQRVVRALADKHEPTVRACADEMGHTAS